MLGIKRACICSISVVPVLYDHGYCRCHRIREYREKIVQLVYNELLGNLKVKWFTMVWVFFSTAQPRNRRCCDSGDINVWCDELRNDVLLKFSV